MANELIATAHIAAVFILCENSFFLKYPIASATTQKTPY
jgi:hypothetical protein